MKHKIYYTFTDEAPALATYSLLPILKTFSKWVDIDIETRNISLSARILVSFSHLLDKNQHLTDDLTFLGNETAKPEANIIKLPNISASVPQLRACIKELQLKNFPIPDYVENPTTDQEKANKEIYGKILGSVVNPILREGNSDRRAPKSVKEYAKKNPHEMAQWSSDSKSHVASMSSGDFYGNEESITFSQDDIVSIVFENENGEKKYLKSGIKIKKNEIVDTTFLSITMLREFIHKQIEDAKKEDLLFSVHLKSTMMKVSDPVMFGAIIEEFLSEFISKNKHILRSIEVNFNNGLIDLYKKIDQLEAKEKEKLLSDLNDYIQSRPKLAMVDPSKGITGLNVPSDVIIDASMPSMIRWGGKMMDSKGKLRDTKAIIPDRCYSGVYQAVIDDCKKNGQLDPRTIGSVSNVGLMAQKAEEYGSHDKTFQIYNKGIVYLEDKFNNKLLTQRVEKGDIFRMCQVKEEAILDWIKLAITRGRITQIPIVFWLDENRAHDREIINMVIENLKNHDISGIELKILSPIDATNYTLDRIKKGLDIISVTGNVLRDYLTDLFPILEVGTSAKMLSIVPLMNGGGLFETGAGGTAPKHVQQFVEEGHLRWDSLGEYLAFCASLEHMATVLNDQKIMILSKTMDQAIGKILNENKNPSKKVGELDNRGGHFYLCYYWAEFLSLQSDDLYLKEKAKEIFEEIEKNESKILSELTEFQNRKIDLGGYYMLNPDLAEKAMRPSKTFHQILTN